VFDRSIDAADRGDLVTNIEATDQILMAAHSIALGPDHQEVEESPDDDCIHEQYLPGRPARRLRFGLIGEQIVLGQLVLEQSEHRSSGWAARWILRETPRPTLGPGRQQHSCPQSVGGSLRSRPDQFVAISRESPGSDRQTGVGEKTQGVSEIVDAQQSVPQ